MEYRELLLGCGNERRKLLSHPMRPGWSNLTTLDINPRCLPDILWDLESLREGGRIPLVTGKPTPDDYYDEIHAYQILEHIGQQGDYRTFFAHFSEFWRILKPQGIFAASVPMWNTDGAWGDPGHRRVITAMTLSFLSQEQYEQQVGVTQMTDYRDIYKANFRSESAWLSDGDQTLNFVLRAVK